MPEPILCQSCGATPEPGDFTMPLCARCRDALSRRPLPKWIRAVSGVVLVVLLFALNQFPSTFRAGLAYERGRRAEVARDYGRAASEYRNVVERFPDSTLALARLGIALLRAERFPEAADCFRKLAGRKVEFTCILQSKSESTTSPQIALAAPRAVFCLPPRGFDSHSRMDGAYPHPDSAAQFRTSPTLDLLILSHESGRADCRLSHRAQSSSRVFPNAREGDGV